MCTNARVCVFHFPLKKSHLTQFYNLTLPYLAATVKVLYVPLSRALDTQRFQSELRIWICPVLCWVFSFLSPCSLSPSLDIVILYTCPSAGAFCTECLSLPASYGCSYCSDGEGSLPATYTCQLSSQCPSGAGSSVILGAAECEIPPVIESVCLLNLLLLSLFSSHVLHLLHAYSTTIFLVCLS